MSGLSWVSAIAFAVVSPTMTPPIRPGPAAAATPSSAANDFFPSAMALAITASSASTWARAAISGTTPPNSACSLTWDRTTLDKMRPCPSSVRLTRAAAVSSQVVSMPRMITVYYIGGMTQTPAKSAIIRIGSRGSPLALIQAREVQSRLAAACGLAIERIEIKTIRTTGDMIQDRPLTEAGGKGVFTKEIEEALLAGAIDLAVHSSKDLPAALPKGLVLAAFLPREDARDAFVSPKAKTLRDLPQGAVVGTASPRRAALVKRLRPDLATVALRGNVETRLRKIEAGEAEAYVMAAAGLKRVVP